MALALKAELRTRSAPGSWFPMHGIIFRKEGLHGFPECNFSRRRMALFLVPVFSCTAMLFTDASQSNGAELEPAILIAEDDENDICLIRRAFHKTGFENPLRIVRNGEEAISYLKGDPPFKDRSENPSPALVLLDIKMPRKNGFEVLTWIREQPEFNPLPVVMLTSSQESTDINRAYALGANSYLVKPASFARLVEMMGRLKEYCSFTDQNVGIDWI